MPSTTYMFEFSKSGRVLAYISARDKKQACERIRHVSHLVCIPQGYRVKVVDEAIRGRAPIFFEKHLRAIENIFKEALAEE